MSEAYVPKFKNTHDALLTVFRDVMAATPEEFPGRVDAFQAFCDALRMVEADEVFPLLFAKHFWEDVQNVGRVVIQEVSAGAIPMLTEEQAICAMALVELAQNFGKGDFIWDR